MGICRGVRNNSGQVAVLFALVFTFLFVLFGFVVDFGHIIHNKMNLQIAADAAAYSGAAWQANTLNRISQLNYHIRQDIKEMAMRLQVTHLRHNFNFPRGNKFINGPAEVPNVEPFICQQSAGYRSLEGRIYDPQTNLCRNASPSRGGLPPIIIPPVIANFDPLAHALQQQIIRIRDEAARECVGAAKDNQILARHLVSAYQNRTRFHADQAVQVGNWLNEIGGGKLSANEQNPIRKTAFESAFRNLTLANKDEFEIEIIPPAGNEYIRLERNSMNGSVFYVNFQTSGDGCVGRPSFEDFTMDAGLNKTQEIMTYFAVRLKSKPKMLFMPQTWLDNNFPALEAVAVAKPFGSRIGPQNSFDNLLPTTGRPGNNSRLVNLSFIPDDTKGLVNTKLMALFDALHPFNEVSRPDGNQDRGWPDTGKEPARLALRLIQSPSIFDSVFYSIHPNPDTVTDYDESEFAESLYPDYLEAGNAQNGVIQTRAPATAPYFPTNGNRGRGWLKVDAKGSAPGGAYGQYADDGPDSHTIQTAGSLGIPVVTDSNAPEFGFATREMVHSGWTPEGRPGRIGYSVKVVGFGSLFSTFVTVTGGGRGRIANLPTGVNYLLRVQH